MAYDTPAQLKARRDRLEAELSRVDNRIAMLEDLPEEPVFEDDEPCVIWFRRRYNETNTKLYTFAATRAGNGLWYVTGAAPAVSGTGRSWIELVQWINVHGDTEIWLATEWESL